MRLMNYNKIMASRNKVTRDGLTFLKAVFAAPDFAGQGKFNGIPDEAPYTSLKYRHVLNASLYALIKDSATKAGAADIYAPNRDILICQPPVPGVAFFWAVVATGAAVVDVTNFIPVFYNDFAQLFGSTGYVQPGEGAVPQLDDLITQFRFAGNSAELICTTNAFNWTGAINAFKGKCSLSECKSYVATGLKSLTTSFTGLENFNNRGMTSTYVAPSNLGVYMTAVNTEPVFPSSTVMPDVYYINANQSNSTGQFRGAFPGIGTLETNFIRLTGLTYTGTGTELDPYVPVTDFQARFWSVLEYIPVEGTVFSNVATPNPIADPAAMDIYRSVVADLPIAVTYAENDSFWKKLLGVVGSVGKALSVIPGWGAIAGGVGMAADAASGLIR